MLIVIEQYNTQEVYINEDLLLKPALDIWQYIENQIFNYYTGMSDGDLKLEFKDWLMRDCNSSTDYRTRHFRIDIYEDWNLEKYKKSIIVYYG